MKQSRRKLFLLLVATSAVSLAAIVATHYYYVSLSRARIRDADALLDAYSKAPSLKLADRLAAVVTDGRVPDDKARAMLRAILAPTLTGSRTFAAQQPVTVVLSQQAPLFKGFYLMIYEDLVVDGEPAVIPTGEVYVGEPRGYTRWYGRAVSRFVPSSRPDGSWSRVYTLPGFPAGRHRGHVVLRYFLSRIPGPVRLATNDARRKLGRRARSFEAEPDYMVSFRTPVEFDVVEAGPEAAER